MFRASSHCSMSCLHTEEFSLRPHRTSHKGNLHRGICNYKLGVHNSSLSNQPPLHKRQGTMPKLNHLYTRGIGTKPNNNHLYTKGIGHKAKLYHNHLYTRGMNTNPKQHHLYTRGIGTKPCLLYTSPSPRDS